MRISLAASLIVFLAVGWPGWSQSGILRYSTNPQYPPYDWAVGEDSFAGASIELLERVLPSGVQAVPVVVPWKRAMEMAKTGQIDLLLSLRINPDRSSYLEFTTHRAFSNPIVVFARAETGLDLSDWSHLKGHRGGVSMGDTFGAGFDEYWRSELNVEQAASMVENFRKLEMGRIDWFVTGKYLGQAWLATHKPAKPVVILEPPISTGDIHFGFSKASHWRTLVTEISQRLADLDKAGVLDQLLQSNLQFLTALPAGSFPGE